VNSEQLQVTYTSTPAMVFLMSGDVAIEDFVSLMSSKASVSLGGHQNGKHTAVDLLHV
jgi:hypothetical protein